ncbi:ribosome maturation factor RimM [Candidatus Finniella inopinata]|uniref:Ribosome maturation factor RimM n=1 Tax=Candidatus Finniella inopinata TaxID=1696036 RepID=A0A4V2DZT3_9PROT|nr:ribosome maturation factor RimM [Candidatus Finniella inopinata]RZI46157.1 16S rRNA processing protein RimM [Candidatus Finniella inopinata]
MTDNTSPQAFICLGEIVGPQSLKGWVRVKTLTESPDDLTAYGPLRTFSGSIVALKIIQVRSQSLVIASVKGCVDRNASESLVGTKLYVHRDQLPHPEEDEFYYRDLIDMQVVDEQGQLVGTIRAVENYGAGDFLDIIDDQKNVYTLPFNKEAVLSVDQEARTLHINRSFLLH